MKAETYKDLPLLTFEKQDEWFDWLEANHDKAPAVWIKFAKKKSGETTITYEQAREGALMYGWIDGLGNAFDDKFHVQRWTPRRPKGVWSKINRGIAEELIKQGRMKPSGLREVENAKLDGRWDAAYDSPVTMQVPKDFEKALDGHPKAKAFFATVNKTNRYAFLWRIHTAIRPETRAARIQKFIGMLERGEVLH